MAYASDRIGFIQGRLSPLVDGKIQAFPWEHWKEEFRLAHELGLPFMEWTLDYERINENPLMQPEGRKQISDFCEKHCMSIPSLTGDFLMQRPFFKFAGEEREGLFNLLIGVVEACGAQGIGKIIFPLVDNGRVESAEEQGILSEYLRKLTAVLEKNDVQICFEFDFPPDKVRSFMKKLPVRSFAVNYDTGNSASLGYDFREELKAYGSRVTNVHIKDRLRQGGSVPLGEGNADIKGAVGWLKNSGYKGNYILQTARSKDGKHAEALSRYKDMLRAYLES